MLKVFFLLTPLCYNLDVFTNEGWYGMSFRNFSMGKAVEQK